MANAYDKWVEISQSNEEKYFLNVDSVKESGAHVEAWIKRVIYNDLTKDGMSTNDYRMSRYRFDCNAQKLGILFSQDYKKNGIPIGSNYSNSYVTLNYAIPDSVGEGILELTCLANEIIQGRITPEDFE